MQKQRQGNIKFVSRMNEVCCESFTFYPCSMHQRSAESLIHSQAPHLDVVEKEETLNIFFNQYLSLFFGLLVCLITCRWTACYHNDSFSGCCEVLIKETSLQNYKARDMNYMFAIFYVYLDQSFVRLQLNKILWV